jgi:hypothetical protein
MAKKKPAKPAKRAAPRTASRKSEGAKEEELSSEDLDSVAGGILIGNAPALDGIKKIEKIAPTIGGALPSYKDLLQ